ncbi:hypothetical protein [Burkholderia multivorans]|uniref:hypothetical protein n=1 Tax=Burkholderia multivorans TaxID=87883 RepID=UPI000CFF4F62|nr:hypothetical protein [Burkholderia multivorans]EKS9914925.1 hypothetical protein [Burkholderia multivorans]MCA7959514.1 hypothetical protein [Burkholderia multivorans]MCO1402848.1 hypothetical protein [Burkholderia multivorans]PRH05446.1 hypothetical protein C6T60_14645 [Burkholderia multivorans]UQO78626.1 hypothetical protein L0Z12_06235 [Burkholderia multivorans]
MKNDSTAANIGKVGEVESQSRDLSSLLGDQARYTSALFAAIEAMAATSPKVAVDLAALGQWLAERTSHFAFNGLNSIALASREVH